MHQCLANPLHRIKDRLETQSDAMRAEARETTPLEGEQKVQNPIKAVLIGPLSVSSWQIDYPCMLWSGRHNGGERQRKKWEGGVCFWLCWGGGRTHPPNSFLMAEQWGKKKKEILRESMRSMCKAKLLPPTM